MKYFFYQNNNAKINTSIKLSDEQQFWRKHTYDRYALMKHSRAQENRENDWNKWDKNYNGWRPPKGANDWQSNIVPPYTTSVVESALSELVDQTLQPKVGARLPENVASATVINFAKDYTWDIGYGDVELYKSLKQQLITGTTIWSDYYWQDKRSVKMMVKYNPKTGQEVYEEREIFDYDDCYGETVNLWDVWFDPYARTVNTGPYKAQDAIRRFIFHIDTFKQMFKGTRWDKFGLVDRVVPGGDNKYYQFYKPPQGIDHGNSVEVIFHWIRNPDKVTMIANDLPCFIGPNPYNHKQLPFAVGHDIHNPWSIYGKGEPQLLESVQDELTTMRRMRLDRQKLDIYKMVFVSARETLTDQDLIPAPMKPVFLEDVNSVKAFEYGDINPSAYREEALLKEDGVRVTGIDDRGQSVPTKGSTATEAAILKESTLKRLRLKIWLTSRTLLQEQIRLRVPNIMQYYKMPKIEKIMGNDTIDKFIKIREAAEQKRLYKEGGAFFEAKYRTIVTKNKKLVRNDKGGVDVIDQRGDNFFMVTPELLTPSENGLLYKMTVEPTFLLSKPLMLQKLTEYVNSPLMQIAIQSGYYDFRKIVDKQTELQDFDPDDFRAGPTKAEKQQQNLVNPEQMLEYASRENEKMLGGEALVGTPFATPEHTQVHMAFMQSVEFKEKASPDMIKVFAKHILEEATAQQLRGATVEQVAGGEGETMQNGVQPGLRTRESEGIMDGDSKAALPARQVGPEGLEDFMGRA